MMYICSLWRRAPKFSLRMGNVRWKRSYDLTFGKFACSLVPCISYSVKFHPFILNEQKFYPWILDEVNSFTLESSPKVLSKKVQRQIRKVL